MLSVECSPRTIYGGQKQRNLSMRIIENKNLMLDGYEESQKEKNDENL